MLSPDSRYGNKRSQTWRGYKVHVSETCKPEQVHLITHVQTTPAQVQDIEQTASIHEALAQKSLLPSQHFVDSGYVTASRQRNPTKACPVLGFILQLQFFFFGKFGN